MKKGLISTLLIAASAIALSQSKAYPIDTWHSKIGFAVSFGGLFDVEGRFNDFRGTVVFDEQDLTKLSATVIISSGSIDTGVGPRDKHLKSEDFFEVEKYPEIKFSSRNVIQEGDQFHLVGDLSMHGTTREVAIPFSIIHGEKADFWQNFRVSLEGAFDLDRSDFGIGKMDDIGNKVTIDLMISARVMNMKTVALFSRPFGKEMIDKLLNGNLEEARTHFDALQSKEDRDAAKPISFARLNLKLMQENNFAKAIQACELGIEIYPEHAPLYTALANTYYQMGLLKNAKEAVDTALKLDQDNTMAIELKKLVDE